MIKKIVAVTLALVMSLGGLGSISKVEASPKGWRTFDAGTNSSIAIRDDGTLWGWGSIAGGGNLPKQLDSDTSWASVATGFGSYVALKEDGTLWSGGDNTYGQLGLGDTTRRNVPTQIGTFRWSKISMFENSVVAIREDGTLWGWGTDQSRDGSFLTQPTQIGSSADWVYVSNGSVIGVGIKTNGTLWAWGESLGSDWMSPRQAGTDTDWVTVSAYEKKFVAIKNNGTLWAWGSNPFGQAGLGDKITRGTPTQVGSDNKWVKAEIGWKFVSAVKSDGTLWTWGTSDVYGYTGTGITTNTEYLTPTQIVSPDKVWASVNAGTYHTLAKDSSGQMYVWGRTTTGALGTGVSSGSEYTPRAIQDNYGDPILDIDTKEFTFASNPQMLQVSGQVKDSTSSKVRVYYTLKGIPSETDKFAIEVNPSQNSGAFQFSIPTSRPELDKGIHEILVWAENEGAMSSAVTILLSVSGVQLDDIDLLVGQNRLEDTNILVFAHKKEKINKSLLAISGYHNATIIW